MPLRQIAYCGGEKPDGRREPLRAHAASPGRRLRVRRVKAAADVPRRRLRDDVGDGAVRQDAPAMQHDQVVIAGDLVDQMRRPDDGDALLVSPACARARGCRPAP